MIQEVEYEFGCRDMDQQSIDFKLYESKFENPRTIRKATKLALLSVPLPQDFDRRRHSVFVKFFFGETTIRVTGRLSTKEAIEKELVLQFHFDVMKQHK